MKYIIFIQMLEELKLEGVLVHKKKQSFVVSLSESLIPIMMYMSDQLVFGFHFIQKRIKQVE